MVTVTGRQLGTVLGKPIYEGDFNKITSTRDNLIRLLLGPLTDDSEAVEELRRITGLDFGNGIDQKSRLAWMQWWEHERYCINNAQDGNRPFVLTGVITDQDGKPISGANVRAQFPFKNSPTGQYQLGTTFSDSSGRYVLVIGLPPFAKQEETTWIATFIAWNPPRFVADASPVVMTLPRNKRETDDAVQHKAHVEKNGGDVFAGSPLGMNFRLSVADNGLTPPRPTSSK
jgi:hypothetical protein